MELITEGAEAQIFKINDSTVKKIRLPKTYRLEFLDKKLRKLRNKREFKILTKLHENNINVPKPFELIQTKDELSFIFEYIQADVLKKTITEKLLKKAFEEIIKMHNLDIIHGDLTTLNMLEQNNKIYLIDFGLSEFSYKIEDKAVDLNLFFTSIKNEHPDLYFLKEELETIYSKDVNLGDKIIERLKVVEHRGRNKN